MNAKRLLLLITLAVTIPSFAAVTNTDAPRMLIPVAGHVRGLRGEVFTTDLTIVNLGKTFETVSLFWLPLGGTDEPQRQTIGIGPLQFTTITDVSTLFSPEGLGAILIEGSDATAALDAQARIATNTIARGVQGSVAQAVPAIRLDGWRNDSPAYVHGARQTGDIRTNYGIVNLSSEPRSFRVVVNSPGGKQEEIVTVPASGTLQRPVPVGARGDLSLYFEPLDGEGAWRGYAASTDNQTASGWTMLAIQPREDVNF